MSLCAVILTESGIAELGEYIAPYLRDGRNGKLIHCSEAVQNGNFIDIIVDPSQTTGRVKDRMKISVPLHFVKFMATGAKSLPIGFSSKE